MRKLVLFPLMFLSIIANANDLKGDANGDGVVDATDIVEIVNYMNGKASDKFNPTLSDMNGDGVVNESDVKLVASLILYGDLNLAYIKKLNSAEKEEVKEILDDLAGTDFVDAETAAESLKTNPNVEEAFSEDGNNLVTKMKGENGYVVYPMYELKSPFTSYESLSTPAQTRGTERYYRPKDVAMFNFFDGMAGHEVQNAIVRDLKNEFGRHDYYVDPYGRSNIEMTSFTYEHLENVLDKKTPRNPAVIIIMSHGCKIKGVSHFATLDEVPDANKDPNIHSFRSGKKSYLLVPTSKIFSKISKNDHCLVYLGICDGASEDEYKKLDIPVIGYTGKTCMAEVNAAILFYLMLDEGYFFDEACNALIREPNDRDSHYVNSKSVNDFTLDRYTDKGLIYEPSYVVDVQAARTITSSKKGVFLAKGQMLDYDEENHNPEFYRIRCQNLFGEVDWYYNPVQKEAFDWGRFDLDGSFMKKASFDGHIEGIYRYIFESVFCQIMENGKRPINTKTDGNPDWRLIRPKVQQFLVVSDCLKENSAEPAISADDLQAPNVSDEKGQKVETIELSVGDEVKCSVTGVSDHAFDVVCLDADVVSSSVSDGQLVVKALSEGSTYIGVYDVQNRQMAIIKVTVGAGSGSESSPTLNASELVIKEGGQETIDISSGSGNYSVESSDPEVASATLNGSSVKIIGLLPGNTIVTITDLAHQSATDLLVTVERVSTGEYIYPKDHYEISEDGTTLLRWTGDEKRIDLGADPAFASLTTVNLSENFSNKNIVVIPNHIKTVVGYIYGATKYLEFSDGDEVLELQDFYGDYSGVKHLYIGRNLSLPLNCSNNMNLRSITFADNVDMAIEDEAFWRCDKLEIVKLGKKITSIGGSAFYESNNLRYINLHSVKRIGGSAFSGLGKLPRKLIIPVSVEQIEDYAFSGTKLEEVIFERSDAPLEIGMEILPPSVKSISLGRVLTKSYGNNYYTFNMEGLQEVIVNCNGLLCEGVFFGAQNLKKVTLEEGVTEIGNEAFRDCSSLESVIIPSTVTRIGEHAFNGCTSILTLTIPSTVNSIGSFGLNGIRNAVISDSAEPLDYEFYNNPFDEHPLEYLYCGRNLVGDNAFSGFGSLVELTIGDQVTGKIEGRGLSKLEKLTIGSGITGFVDGWAFYECSSLKEVKINQTTPPELSEYSHAFYETPRSEATLYVPKGSEDAYREANVWKEFGTIIGF